MAETVHYDWKRYWVSRDGSIPTWFDGFPLDPESDDGKLSPVKLLVYGEISRIPCLALLGEPGIGKSTGLEEIRNAPPANNQTRLFLNLNGYSTDSRLFQDLFESTEFKTWINGTHDLEILLDSLDECLIHVRTVAAMLVNELRKYPRSRLRLRIACRTAEWPSLLSEELPKLWADGGFGAYELAPLLKRNVETALDSNRIPKDAFFQSVYHHHAVALARSPLTLEFLIKTWNAQAFPADAVDLYLRGCRELCGEPSRNRKDQQTRRLSSEQALALAQRIAALMILGKRAVIRPGDRTTDDEISLAEMEGGQEPCGQGQVVQSTIQNLREVVGTALFNGRSNDRMGWSHWSYAEFLAACYLKNRIRNVAQIRDLVMHPDRTISQTTQVVPQLHETVSWLCAMMPEFVKEVSAGSPEILVRSTKMTIAHANRMQIVDSLLTLASNGDRRRSLEWAVRDDYSVLKHETLPQQIGRFISGSGQDIDARELAIDIARACEIRELLPEITRVALNPSEPTRIREAAAYSVRDLADQQYSSQLNVLLALTEAEDPDENLKGVALDALWPLHLTAMQLFQHLTPPRRRSYYGGYAGFLSRLSRSLRREDLRAALAWAKTQPMDRSLPLGFQEVLAGVLNLACAHIDDQEVLSELADWIAERLKRHESVAPEGYDKKEPLVFVRDVAVRRQVLESVISLLPPRPAPRPYFDAIHLRDLVLSEDLAWIVDRAVASTDTNMQTRWVACIYIACDWSKPANLELIFAGMVKSPHLNDAFREQFEAVEIESAKGRKMKADHLRWQRMERRFKREEPPQLEEPFGDIVHRRLEAAESHDVDAWWRLNVDLTIRPPIALYHLEDEHKSDLTELPAWQSLNADDKARCVSIAAWYIENADPNTADWLGKDTFHRPAAAGYRAIRLLEKLSPQGFAAISRPAWAKWAPIIIAFPELDLDVRSDRYSKIITKAYEAAPNEVISTLGVLMKKEDAAHGHVFVIRRLQWCWDSRLSDAVISYIEREAFKASSIGSVLDELLEYRPMDANRALSLVSAESMKDSADANKLIQIAAALLAHAPRESWNVLWPLIQKEGPLGEAILSYFALHHDEMHTAKIAAILDEGDAAALFVWLMQHFPPANDPKHNDDGMHAVGERDAVIMLRDSVLRCLQAKGTAKACAAVEHIIAALPEHPWLKRVRPGAAEAAMKATWRGQPTNVILSLAESSEKRIVESDEQLLGIVVESLGRLERKLHGTTPAVYDLWDESAQKPKDEKRLSDYIKRYLEDDLKNQGIVANREVEIRDGVRAPGEVSDILVQAVNRIGITTSVFSVLVEVKGCWNQDLKTAMQDQLRDRYLRQNQCQTGLYVIGWFPCSFWSSSDYRKDRTPKWSIDAARKHFREQASSLSLPIAHLNSYVLDARVRSSPSPQ